MRRLTLLVAMTALGCTQPASDQPLGGDPVSSTDDGWKAPEDGVIQLNTADGVMLEADYWAPETKGAPGVILVHMIPPHNTRVDWPTGFIEALTAQGMSVLRFDRRGAGGSGGEPKDSYEGPAGKLDVAAAVDRMKADGVGDFVVIGASNGTTSALDYTVWAEGEAGHPVPKALGFLSGGTYTEKQNPVSALPAMPVFFAYPPDEAEWPASVKGSDPGSWELHSYEGGAHGTRMWGTTAEEDFQSDLLAFITAQLAAGQ